VKVVVDHVGGSMIWGLWLSFGGIK